VLAEFVMIVVGGLKFGAIYALAALGIVVIHKADAHREFRPRRVRACGRLDHLRHRRGLNLGYWPAYVLVPIAMACSPRRSSS
jgi:hypothetical protein